MIASDSILRDLMIKSQQGDKSSYAALLKETAKWLKRYYAQKIAPDMVDDLIQETLMSVHKKIQSYDSSRAFLPWLAAIARYRWVDKLRQEYKHAADEIPETIGEDSHEEVVIANIGISRLLDQIPPAQAEVIRLTKIEGHSIADACERTGQSEALVKVNVHRGLKKMAALIESE
ncbi:RNA polymerase subunit sigma-24 [Sphingorhabdus lutea]|uniref:RNA polymerase subunit sigma-24 n=1 Tax=Sphingorhabdus lutea TaxID=1913578 RepID=A0A1L3JB70_9SPHN|nr:sigma-70 family RNA polymerase sigma factor [Sphingorhabdus lutea]APG62303.1 RNA polymerase subunit sigma-24 [Sphingorhabdus lutea]